MIEVKSLEVKKKFENNGVRERSVNGEITLGRFFRRWDLAERADRTGSNRLIPKTQQVRLISRRDSIKALLSDYRKCDYRKCSVDSSPPMKSGSIPIHPVENHL